MRVTDYLAGQNVRFDPIPHAPANNAARRAKWLRTPRRLVATAALLAGPDGLVLAVVRASHAIDLDGLARCWAGPLRPARPEEVAALFSDCEWGTVPAFGNLYGLPTLLDAGIGKDDEMAFEVGSRFVDVRLRCRDYERITGAMRLDFARPIER